LAEGQRAVENASVQKAYELRG